MAADHTIGHRDCPACVRELKTVTASDNWGELRVPEAARRLLELRAPKLRPSTLMQYRDYANSLSKFFEVTRVKRIHIGQVVSYQKHRQQQIRASAQHKAVGRKLGTAERASDGASKINHEISCILQPIMQRAGLWAPLGKHYEPLPMPRHGAGFALTEQEEAHLFATAKSRPQWMVAYCCALLTRNTTRGAGELRHLRVRSVDLGENPLLRIEDGAKNKFREGIVPLNADAVWAASWLLQRQLDLCGRYGVESSPDHYLLPHRALVEGRGPEFDMPQGSWRCAWGALRAEAGKKFPRLSAVRYYDLRHTAATVMLEDPRVSYGSIEMMMGHRLGSETKRRYQHIRDTRIRAAAEVLNSGHTPGQPAKTSNTEKAAETAAPAPSTAEKISNPPPRKTPQRATSTLQFMGVLDQSSS